MRPMKQRLAWFKLFESKVSRQNVTILDVSLKAQFKSADVFAAKTLITLGSSEVEVVKSLWKNNQTRQEVTVALESLKKDFPSVLAELGLAWSNRERQGRQDLSGSRGKMVAPALFLFLYSVCRPLPRFGEKAVKFSGHLWYNEKTTSKGNETVMTLVLPINTRRKNTVTS